MLLKEFTVTLVSVLVFGSVSQAQYKKFKIPMGTPQDLMRETQSLKLQKEESVQIDLPPTAFYMGVLGGTVQPSSLTLDTHGHVTTYDFSKPLTLVTAQFSHFPFL